jgi:8-hydroxy-5-deazaflavin:NADPH oxidoreductase
MSDLVDSSARTIGFIGGTGPQGRGLGMRLAQAGYRVLIGSRSAEKAQTAVDAIAGKVPGLPVEGLANPDVCAQADVVVVTVPYEAQRATLEGLAEAIGDKVVVNCVNSLGFDAAGPHAVPVPAGSAAEECAQLLSRARVVGAWQNVSAVRLGRPDEPVDVDVLLTGDDDDARAVVAELVEAIPGMRAVHAGPLRLSRPIEEMTAVLIAVNKRYKTHAGVKVAGLEHP